MVPVPFVPTHRIDAQMIREAPRVRLSDGWYYTLRDIARLNPKLAAADAVARGLATAQFDPDECCIKSGALYVYDRLALSAILRGWASTLEAEGIPSDPGRFVAYVAANWLGPTHAAYPVIAATFGDTV
jgi:hypothetical protein